MGSCPIFIEGNKLIQITYFWRITILITIELSAKIFQAIISGLPSSPYSSYSLCAEANKS